MEERSGTQLIEELLDLEHSDIVDVGCGDGWLTRFLAGHGGHVTGIEVSPRQLVNARSIKQVADEQYMQGIAEELPIRSRSTDIVIFYNSLHHVDADGLPKAFREASRVLRHGGVLYVSEPMAEGAYFDLMKPAHDETLARRQAQEALRHAPEFGLLVEKQLSHIDSVKFRDFRAFHDRITSINPHTRARFDDQEEDMRANFERLGVQVDDGWVFQQPMRVAVLRRS